MAKKSGDTRSGMGWTLVSQNVAIGVAIVILHDLAAGMGLRVLPLVGMLFFYFMPMAFVVVMTYFRSEQRTKGQAVAEGLFAGFIFLIVMFLVSAIFSLLTPSAT
jgi:hypothetical protein